MLFIFATCAFGFFSNVFGQPGVSFDASIPCWINVTSEWKDSYSETQYAALNQYLVETVVLPVQALPLEEQVDAFLDIFKKVADEIFWKLYPPITLKDFHEVGNYYIQLPLLAQPNELLYNSDNYYLYYVVANERVIRVCVDDETEPNYDFILKHAIQHNTRWFVDNEIIGIEIDSMINATAIGLTNLLQTIDDLNIDFEDVALDLVEGAVLGIQNATNNDNIDIQQISMQVASGVLALEDRNSTGVESVVMQAFEELGIEVDSLVLDTAVSSVISELLDTLGK